MELCSVGRKIQEERKRKNVSQQDLCMGICSISTLSRIENGTQKPTLKVEEALLERLGCGTENLSFFAGEEEIKKHRLEIELGLLMMNRNPLETELTLYKELISSSPADKLYTQFALLAEAVYSLYSGKWSLDKVKDQLEKAICLTIPNFMEKELADIKLLTLTEITLLNNLGIVQHKQEKYPEAMQIWRYLITYLEKGDLSVDTMRHKYPMLIVNLTKLLVETNNSIEALEFINKGISFCKEYGRLTGLENLFYYKAVSHVRLEQIQEAKECYEYAICLSKINENLKITEQMVAEYEEYKEYIKRNEDI